MGWTWLFVTFAFGLFMYAEAAAQLNSGYIVKIVKMDPVMDPVILELVKTILYFMSYFAPMCLLISTILFYPSYRSVCFGTQGYDSNLWAHAVAPVPHTGIQVKPVPIKN